MVRNMSERETTGNPAYVSTHLVSFKCENESSAPAACALPTTSGWNSSKPKRSVNLSRKQWEQSKPDSPFIGNPTDNPPGLGHRQRDGCSRVRHVHLAASQGGLDPIDAETRRSFSPGHTWGQQAAAAAAGARASGTAAVIRHRRHVVQLLPGQRMEEKG
ncbi:hypothetical protein C8J57DRAFT_1230648 [Mycena rebaudengoi]|nr:hypothetical protein C8J57DRAFT_1230648 [Mycena rebaudengoi]